VTRKWLISVALTLLASGSAPPTDVRGASLAGLAKEQGNGARFKLHSQGSAHDLYVALVKVDDSSERVVIEVFAAAEFADPLWQQFVLSVKGDRPSVEAGYVQMGNRDPMKLTEHHLAGTDGLDVSLFLLSEAELRTNKGKGLKDLKEVGPETIATPAGTMVCSHYRLERPEQRLDLWVSDEARPIGLVRLISAGKKQNDNYRLELQELLSGVVAKINPAKAGPLSEDLKALFAPK
jgi:hypothetical protein